MSTAITNLLNDSFPDIKIKISEIFAYIPGDIIIDGKTYLESIIKVTRHKRWKVRLAGTQAIYDLILRKECQCLCDSLIPEFKRLSLDNNKVNINIFVNYLPLTWPTK